MRQTSTNRQCGCAPVLPLSCGSSKCAGAAPDGTARHRVPPALSAPFSTVPHASSRAGAVHHGTARFQSRGLKPWGHCGFGRRRGKLPPPQTSSVAARAPTPRALPIQAACLNLLWYHLLGSERRFHGTPSPPFFFPQNTTLLYRRTDRRMTAVKGRTTATECGMTELHRGADGAEHLWVFFSSSFPETRSLQPPAGDGENGELKLLRGEDGEPAARRPLLSREVARGDSCRRGPEIPCPPSLRIPAPLSREP